MTTQPFTKERWQTLLPESFHWLEKVSVATTTDVIPGAHHVIGVTAGEEGSDDYKISATNLNPAFATKVLAAAKAYGWKGAGGYFRSSIDGVNVVLAPVSKLKVSDLQKARQFGIDASRGLKDAIVDSIVLVEPKGLDVLAVFEGLADGLYSELAFKGSTAKKLKLEATMPKKVSLLTSGTVSAERIARQIEFSKSTAFTRFLQDAPPNWLTPVKFGEIAKEMATERGVKADIVGQKEIEALGMGSFLSVSKGSDFEPRLITIEIDGEDNSKCIALIGKGLTFDAGGISIKPAPSMDEMKYDMSGAGAVLGSAMYLSKVKPPTKVVCIIGAVENVISGSATRPGDVVVAMNGKTIEVLNTDAEGRLVLCDLMCFANEEFKPVLMIDIATLTGAVLMALGTAGSALLSNDQASADYVLEASRRAGEPFWQLPMWPELDGEVKGETGDLRNIAKPSVKAGTIIGATFLKEFAGKTKWVHLDIAGTANGCKATGYPGPGGSAYGLRTMVEACLRYDA